MVLFDKFDEAIQYFEKSLQLNAQPSVSQGIFNPKGLGILEQFSIEQSFFSKHENHLMFSPGNYWYKIIV